jgi:hypothetical protein
MKNDEKPDLNIPALRGSIERNGGVWFRHSVKFEDGNASSREKAAILGG